MSGLQAQGLIKHYRGRAVANGVTLHIQPGEVVGLLGPNGAGKTTSFSVMAGFLPVRQKKVFADTAHRVPVNPGSVGQPRDGDWRAAWSLLDLDSRRRLPRAVMSGPGCAISEGSPATASWYRSARPGRRPAHPRSVPSKPPYD